MEEKTFKVRGKDIPCARDVEKAFGDEIKVEEEKKIDVTKLLLHPSIAHFIPLFQYEHLPENLQERSKPFCELAKQIMNKWPSNPETTVALRKLREAKDAAVTAFIVEEYKNK